ncbi:MAG: four helix bundle protein [Hyphomicrobium sp.]|nr:four helix bundle protein [Hyphomicrobium sp.]
MTQGIRSYRDLRVWQMAMDLAEEAYRLTRVLPAAEMYGMSSQMRRSSASIAANIAEGYGRETTGAYVQFLRTARGSLKEFETHILLAERVGLVEPASSAPLLKRAEDLGRMLNALIKSLRSRQQG